MSELHDRIMDAIPPGGSSTVGRLAKNINSEKKTVLNACLMLDAMKLVSVRKPLFGVFGDYSIKKLKEVSAIEKAKIKCKVTAIINQKGGVGKTITAINVAGCLSKLGKRTLLVDLDPQGNSTGILAEGKPQASLYDALISDAQAERIIVKTRFGNLDVMPSDINLAGAEVDLVNVKDRESRLKQLLDAVKGGYEYVIIDCPPALSLLTINALVAADSALIPVQCDYFALDGLNQLSETIDLVKERLNARLEIEGLLLTMYEPQNQLSVKTAEEVKKQFKSNVFETVIHRDATVGEAAKSRTPLIYYDESARSSIEYLKVAKKITENG